MRHPSCNLGECYPDCAERATCTESNWDGHTWCGMCDDHGRPRHTCGCNKPEPIEPEPTTDPVSQSILYADLSAAFGDAPAGVHPNGDRPSDVRLWPL